jgi:hypothetical protein
LRRPGELLRRQNAARGHQQIFYYRELGAELGDAGAPRREREKFPQMMPDPAETKRSGALLDRQRALR